MDAMNGLGQVCRVEEVDDIGGQVRNDILMYRVDCSYFAQCWAYFRVSIHGIKISASSQPVAVAVGGNF
jgi:hypothetical protein